DECDGREVRRERGPGAVVDLRDMASQVRADLAILLGGHEQVLPADLAVDAHPLEAEQCRIEVLDGRVPDQDLAAGDRGEADEAAHLNVVAADAEPTAAQAVDALEVEHAGPDARDLRA